MTLPIGLPQAAAEPAAAAPNAVSGAAGQAPESDATTAQFAAVLLLMLGGGVQASPAQPRSGGIPVAAPEQEPQPDADSTDDTSEPQTAGSSETTGTSSAQDSSPPTPDTGTSASSPAAAAIAALIGGATPNESPSADLLAVRRDLDLLAPDFRERLERVIDRMASEYGYKVDIVETYRTPARQDVLFAQGRTEPGQVVTWTRASHHTLGHAADLVVDGSYDDPVAYQRLMRIARDEGLRTLGQRDPGHVELAAPRAAPIVARPAPSVASPASIVAAARELESPAPAAAVARVAAVAPVAQVAQVAHVAQVAPVGSAVRQVAALTSSLRGRGAVTPASRGLANGAGASPLDATAAGAEPIPSLATVATPSSVAGQAGASRDGAGDLPNDRRASPRTIEASAARDSATDVLRQARDELMHAVAGTDPSSTSQSHSLPSEAAGAVGHADMTERIARLLKVHDAAGERPMSQMLLRLERPDGGIDRVRVDLRGNAVSATLDVTDAQAADRLGANVKELQRALERHGFETDSLTVRTASRAVESSALARAASASVESELQRTTAASPSGTFTNTSSRERGARHDEQRPSPDSQRHRSRREQKGER